MAKRSWCKGIDADGLRCSVGVFVFVVLCGVGGLARADGQRPNVVIFLVDDMGWMDSGVYGSQYYETPNIDRFAEQSMRFTDAYALPLCSPTRASILTGQYSARHGITSATGHRPAKPAATSAYPEKAPPHRRFLYADSKNYLDPDMVTLAEVLRAAGYRTGHFGKWHLGLMPQHWPDKQGFETIFHCAPDPGPPNYFSPYGVHAEGHPSGRHRVGNITDGPEGEHIADRLTDEAIKFLRARRDEPFYLNLWHYSVHGPWQHKEEYTAEFARKTDPRGEQRNPVMASMLRCVDESLGRILDTLDELRLADNTLFIFFSDNGGNCHSWRADDPKLRRVTEDHPLYETIRSYRKWAGPEPPTNNAPLREGKGRIYEGGQRVPLVVRWPGKVEPGSTCSTVVGAIDLYPTILDALNLEKPSGHTVDGISMLPLLQKTGELDRQAYFTWFPHLIPAVSVRQGPWKLIRRFESHPDYPEVRELYNLEDDIGETNNLADRMPQKVKALDALIDRFVEQTAARYPRPNPSYDPVSAAIGGLVPKMCSVHLIEGAIRVEAAGRTPFLGTAQVRHGGPITVRLCVRSAAGGPGEVRWKSADEDGFPDDERVVPFTLQAGDSWQVVRVELPVERPPQIVRVYLPAKRGPVEIRSLEFRGQGAKCQKWDFAGVRP